MACNEYEKETDPEFFADSSGNKLCLVGQFENADDLKHLCRAWTLCEMVVDSEEHRGQIVQLCCSKRRFQCPFRGVALLQKSEQQDCKGHLYCRGQHDHTAIAQHNETEEIVLTSDSDSELDNEENSQMSQTPIAVEKPRHFHRSKKDSRGRRFNPKEWRILEECVRTRELLQAKCDAHGLIKNKETALGIYMGCKQCSSTQCKYRALWKRSNGRIYVRGTHICMARNATTSKMFAVKYGAILRCTFAPFNCVTPHSGKVWTLRYRVPSSNVAALARKLRGMTFHEGTKHQKYYYCKGKGRKKCPHKIMVIKHLPNGDGITDHRLLIYHHQRHNHPTVEEENDDDNNTNTEAATVIQEANYANGQMCNHPTVTSHQPPPYVDNRNNEWPFLTRIECKTKDMEGLQTRFGLRENWTRHFDSGVMHTYLVCSRYPRCPYKALVHWPNTGPPYEGFVYQRYQHNHSAVATAVREKITQEKDSSEKVTQENGPSEQMTQQTEEDVVTVVCQQNANDDTIQDNTTANNNNGNERTFHASIKCAPQGTREHEQSINISTTAKAESKIDQQTAGNDGSPPAAMPTACSCSTHSTHDIIIAEEEEHTGEQALEAEAATFELAQLEKEFSDLSSRHSLRFRVKNNVTFALWRFKLGDRGPIRMLLIQDEGRTVRLTRTPGCEIEQWPKTEWPAGPDQFMREIDAKCREYFNDGLQSNSR